MQFFSRKLENLIFFHYKLATQLTICCFCLDFENINKNFVFSNNCQKKQLTAKLWQNYHGTGNISQFWACSLYFECASSFNFIPRSFSVIFSRTPDLAHISSSKQHSDVEKATQKKGFVDEASFFVIKTNRHTESPIIRAGLGYQFSESSYTPRGILRVELKHTEIFFRTILRAGRAIFRTS